MSSAFDKARQLSAAEWVVLAKAALLLLAAMAAIRLLPAGRVLAWAQRGKPRLRIANGTIPPGRLAGLVEAAAARLRPRPTCLVKALVLCRLMRERGFRAELVVGAVRWGGQNHARATAAARSLPRAGRAWTDCWVSSGGGHPGALATNITTSSSRKG